MNRIKHNNYAKTKKLICDWTNEKNYLIQYRLLKFYIRHGIIVDEIREIISFKQNKWLEKYIILMHKYEIGLKKISKRNSINY